MNFFLQKTRWKNEPEAYFFPFLAETNPPLTVGKKTFFYLSKRHGRASSKRKICAFTRSKSMRLAEGKKNLFSLFEGRDRASRGRKKRVVSLRRERRCLSRKQICAFARSKSVPLVEGCSFSFPRGTAAPRRSKSVPRKRKKNRFFTQICFKNICPKAKKNQRNPRSQKNHLKAENSYKN